MPRRARSIIGGYAYHILNRANGRLRLFKKDADFAAFEQVLSEAHQRVPLRILGYVLMSNHWHFVVWPRQRQHEQVSEFFRWLSVTHSQRWHAHHGTSGMGHVYQGRFKSFPVASDEHLLTVLRYVERNPLRAGIVRSAELWKWGSLYRRTQGSPEERALLTDPPVQLGRTWPEHVNQPESEAELAALRESVARGRPYGGPRWRDKVVRQLGLEHTMRPRGRPKKESPAGAPPPAEAEK
ncbi:MAG: transposase [Planctomycetia bacterium]|nr:transposase [Planctomycetia bacterium]